MTPLALFFLTNVASNTSLRSLAGLRWVIATDWVFAFDLRRGSEREKVFLTDLEKLWMMMQITSDLVSASVVARKSRPGNTKYPKRSTAMSFTSRWTDCVFTRKPSLPSPVGTVDGWWVAAAFHIDKESRLVFCRTCFQPGSFSLPEIRDKGIRKTKSILGKGGQVL